MAKLLALCLSTCFVWASAESDALNEQGTLFFYCHSPFLSRDVLVYFDTSGGWSSSSLLTDQHLELYRDILVRNDNIPSDLEFASLTSYGDACTVKTAMGDLAIPVTLYWLNDGGAEFAVADISPSSPLFDSTTKAVALSSIVWGEFGASVRLLVASGDTSPSDRYGCFSGAMNNMVYPPVLSDANIWKVGISRFGFHNPLTNASLPFSRPTIASIQSAVHGIVLPSAVFDDFVAALRQISGSVLRVNGDSLFIQNCYIDDVGFAGDLPHLVLGFEGQDAFRLYPNAYLDKSANKECRVTVFRGDGSEAILGDSLFASGLVQFSRNQGLLLCPSLMDTVVVPSTVVGPRPKSDFAMSGNNGLLVGITVGGVVLLVAVIAFFVIRAKRKQRAERDRYSASRPMVADPSISDAASEASEHVRV